SWLKAAYVDQGPTKDRRRMRPAPQGRAYKERRHFCHVTVLVSSDSKEAQVKADGKADEVKPTASKHAKRGGAAAAPRVKRAEKSAAASEVSEAPERKAAKKSSKAGSKLGSALRRKKKEEE